MFVTILCREGYNDMKRIIMTSILYSKRNYDLAYKLHLLCKRHNLNLVSALDFVELTIKSVELKPLIIFCDCETIHYSSSNLNAFLEKNEFKNTKIVFVGNDEQVAPIKNMMCNNLMTAKVNELTNVVEEIESNLNYEKLMENEFNCYDGLELDIFRLLSSIGLSPKHSGYNYLRYEIKKVVLNNGKLNALTTEQYPIIASVFKTSPANVERNIRNAIYQAWKTFGKDNWSKTFCLKSLEEGKRPTNMEFIYMCSELILSQYRSKLISATN